MPFVEDQAPQEETVVEQEAPKAAKKKTKAKAKAEATAEPKEKKPRAEPFKVLDIQKIKVTAKGKEATYRDKSKRHQLFYAVRDGMTVGEYLEENGKEAKTFLRWFVVEDKTLDIE